MNITYEEVIPSPITNATVRKGIVDGVHRNYNVQANEGYILHDKELDFTRLVDFETMETALYLGFTTTICSCVRTYDWDANPREFYCVPNDGTIPSDQIFGGANNNHEIA